jgi:hypothetical protein
MELTAKDKAENAILAMIVVPKSDRLYNYFINGQDDKRSMLQRKMLEFCLNLCPDHAAEIRKAIFQLTPFVIYPEENGFESLKEREPAGINRRELLLPMGKLAREDKIDILKRENGVQKLGKRLNIWENTEFIWMPRKKAESKKNGLLSTLFGR